MIFESYIEAAKEKDNDGCLPLFIALERKRIQTI
jgi:hypothetical protein